MTLVWEFVNTPECCQPFCKCLAHRYPPADVIFRLETGQVLDHVIQPVRVEFAP